MRSITLFFVAAAMVFSSCGSVRILKAIGEETVSPIAFKVQIPFIHPKNDRTFIPVFFEKENVTRTLLFDTGASTCMMASVVKNNAAYAKIGEFFIKKPTPDGKKIPNIVYKTDKLKLGNLSFDKVVVNELPDRTDTVFYKYEGIFGTNLMAKGIWKIDFEHNQFTFASSIDSIQNVADAQKLAVIFDEKKIKADLSFENNVQARVELDFGSNGGVSLKKEIFDKIDLNHKATASQSTSITAAGEQKITKYVLESTPFKLGDKTFSTSLYTNNLMNRNLLGMKYFEQFKFVILDYINKAVYVSNEKMPK
jgi:hypothetical protein